MEHLDASSQNHELHHLAQSVFRAHQPSRPEQQSLVGEGEIFDQEGTLLDVWYQFGTSLYANFAAGDLSDYGAMQRHGGHVLHLLEPAEEASGSGLGFGVIPRGRGAGQQLEAHLYLLLEGESLPRELR